MRKTMTIEDCFTIWPPAWIAICPEFEKLSLNMDDALMSDVKLKMAGIELQVTQGRSEFYSVVQLKDSALTQTIFRLLFSAVGKSLTFAVMQEV